MYMHSKKKTADLDEYFNNCLYFTANALAREVTRMSEEAFARLGLSSSQAFQVMLVVEQPGISQKELAEYLNLAPSTVSRFTDKLILRGLVRKEMEGRNTLMYPTREGKAIKADIEAAWHELYKRYSKVLGKKEGEAITEHTRSVYLKLKE